MVTTSGRLSTRAPCWAGWQPSCAAARPTAAAGASAIATTTIATSALASASISTATGASAALASAALTAAALTAAAHPAAAGAAPKAAPTNASTAGATPPAAALATAALATTALHAATSHVVHEHLRARQQRRVPGRGRGLPLCPLRSPCPVQSRHRLRRLRPPLYGPTLTATALAAAQHAAPAATPHVVHEHLPLRQQRRVPGQRAQLAPRSLRSRRPVRSRHRLR